MDAAHTIPRRILVALDGSPGSKRALEWAIGMAEALEAEIVGVHVAQLFPYLPAAYGLPPYPLTDDQQAELRDLFEKDWCAPLRAAGLRYRTRFEQGIPAPTLIAVAESEGAGLIVTGTRGFGGFKELLLGSVSHQLVQHAGVPVVVIPPERKGRQHVIATREPAVTSRQAPLERRS